MLLPQLSVKRASRQVNSSGYSQQSNAIANDLLSAFFAQWYLEVRRNSHVHFYLQNIINHLIVVGPSIMQIQPQTTFVSMSLFIKQKCSQNNGMSLSVSHRCGDIFFTALLHIIEVLGSCSCTALFRSHHSILICLRSGILLGLSLILFAHIFSHLTFACRVGTEVFMVNPMTTRCPGGGCGVVLFAV